MDIYVFVDNLNMQKYTEYAQHGKIYSVEYSFQHLKGGKQYTPRFHKHVHKNMNLHKH